MLVVVVVVGGSFQEKKEREREKLGQRRDDGGGCTLLMSALIPTETMCTTVATMCPQTTEAGTHTIYDNVFFAIEAKRGHG